MSKKYALGTVGTAVYWIYDNGKRIDCMDAREETWRQLTTEAIYNALIIIDAEYYGLTPMLTAKIVDYIASEISDIARIIAWDEDQDSNIITTEDIASEAIERVLKKNI